MYRDDPLADEEELRAILGDEAVDRLADADGGPEGPLEVAVDVLRVLQGWVDDEQAATWFSTPQTRLEGRTPLEALEGAAFPAVRDAARRWVAAQA
jgi:hypothetical protein